MVFRKTKEEKVDSEELLRKASRSKPEELKGLLKQIEDELKKVEKDNNLLTAKTIITSRLASMRSK